METNDVTLPVRENLLGNLEICEKHKEIRNKNEVVCVYPHVHLEICQKNIDNIFYWVGALTNKL